MKLKEVEKLKKGDSIRIHTLRTTFEGLTEMRGQLLIRTPHGAFNPKIVEKDKEDK